MLLLILIGCMEPFHHMVFLTSVHSCAKESGGCRVQHRPHPWARKRRRKWHWPPRKLQKRHSSRVCSLCWAGSPLWRHVRPSWVQHQKHEGWQCQVYTCSCSLWIKRLKLNYGLLYAIWDTWSCIRYCWLSMLILTQQFLSIQGNLWGAPAMFTILFTICLQYFLNIEHILRI